MLARVSLSDDLRRVAARAGRFARPEEELSGILAAEPSPGARVYLCAYAADGARPSWLALDGDGDPISERARVREAVSIAALCELAAETAGGGELEELRARLKALRLRESPAGIDEAEASALELERTIGAPPELATPRYLDEVGTAAVRLEEALGQNGASQFAEAMKGSTAAVESLTADVESGYKLPLV